MRNIALITLIASGSLISGCATTSFAPPSVNTGRIIKLSDADTVDGKPCSFANQTGGKIHNTVAGARHLIDNFILKYRCTYRTLANGRRNFEIPAFVSAVGGAAAAAFGAGPNVAIGTGTGAAVFNGGKRYFAPQEKAAMINKALDALLCIKAEAVGVTPFSTETIPAFAAGENTEKGNLVNDAAAPTVEVSPATQYFDMISAAVLSVERILADHLSSAGKYDAAGVIAEIEALNKAVDDAKNKAETKKINANGTPTDAAGAVQAEALWRTLKLSKDPALATPLQAAVEKNTTLDLNVMQPKLQRCVVRAKL
jgi:hypothetical protein